MVLVTPKRSHCLIAELNCDELSDESKSVCSHVGCPRALHRFVLLDGDRSQLAQLKEVTALHDDCELQLHGSRYTNWALAPLASMRSSFPVNVYVHDTGIVPDENEFTSLTTLYAHKSPNSYRHHGTNVASMASGNQYGVAPNCQLYSVETNLYLSDLIKGYDVILAHYQSSDLPGVVNMSYGGYNLPSVLENVIRTMASAGLIMVAAAGNEGKPYASEPARYDSVISVGSVNARGQISSWSNYGDGVDVYAPGESVRLVNGVTSGSSFSAPLVTGLFARLLVDHAPPRTDYDAQVLRAYLLHRIKELTFVQVARKFSLDTTAISSNRSDSIALSSTAHRDSHEKADPIFVKSAGYEWAVVLILLLAIALAAYCMVHIATS